MSLEIRIQKEWMKSSADLTINVFCDLSVWLFLFRLLSSHRSHETKYAVSRDREAQNRRINSPVGSANLGIAIHKQFLRCRMPGISTESWGNFQENSASTSSSVIWYLGGREADHGMHALVGGQKH